MLLLFYDFIIKRFKYFLDNVESSNTDLYLKSIIIKYQVWSNNHYQDKGNHYFLSGFYRRCVVQ